MSMNLPPELKRIQEEIEGYARDYGLDFCETIFEILDFKQLNEVASFMGFPNRFPHWRFGMEYERLSKSYAYGLHKIYEMVINNDPCYAYLLQCNNYVDQKIVMAHVYGHGDFFKNNFWFSKTNRKMMDEMANHATKVRKYIDKYGYNEVEEFIDICLSIDDLIDRHAPFIERRGRKVASDLLDPEAEQTVKKIKSKDYMEEFINPPDFMELQQRKIEEDKLKKRGYPEAPEKDVVLFLIENAPLENWQREILELIREESYYFAPQGQTKIMNEGWATYWHSKIMTQRALRDSELIDYADHHSGTVATQPTRINPYKLGLELFKDIEDRWNRGKFGKEYEECDNIETKKSWDKDLGLGREKIFEVRKIYNDVTFIDTFMTEEFCEEQKLFVYKYSPEQEAYVISDRDFRKVKQQLLFSLTNFGQPFIFVKESNYENRGELYLYHRHEGIDLKVDYGKETLRNIQTIWTRPVYLETVVEGRGKIFKFDGEKHSERNL
ncbi:MAG: SpoVR family protein [Acidobacteria bacterium]|nr:MAG: SpoVR family protein [Acidobacteriota bacterium]